MKINFLPYGLYITEKYKYNREDFLYRDGADAKGRNGGCGLGVFTDGAMAR